MTASAQLRLRVHLDGRDPYDVETRLIDHNIWDTTRAKHGWPPTADAPMTWLGFIAWTASRRTGRIDPALTWEAFLGECVSVENVSGDDESDVADPIQPGPGPG